MSMSIFFELQFWLLVVFSLVLPIGILAVMFVKRAISKSSVLLLGLALVAIAGVDVYLLQSLAAAARGTPSLADDRFFSSEVSLALYLIPAMIGGIGTNVVSQVLIRHLREAERAFERRRAGRPPGRGA